MLRRDHGMFINKKKIYRICDENGLLLEQRSKHSRPLRQVSRSREVIRPRQVWQCELKYGYVDGELRFFFIMAFIDVFTRKISGEHVGLRCQTGDLRNALARALRSEGITTKHELVIRSDNGPQMTTKEVRVCLASLEEKLMHDFIPVRTPNKNAHIESFFSLLELEFLRVTYFSIFSEAYEKTHKFIQFYNEEGTYGSIGDIAPAETMTMHQRGDLLSIKTISM